MNLWAQKGYGDEKGLESGELGSKWIGLKSQARITRESPWGIN